MTEPTGNLVDLHTHTVYSDGVKTPAELVELAAAAGVRFLAVTDHDNVDGLAEARAAAAPLGVEIIPGIELSTDVADGEIHVLGYFINDQDPELARLVSVLRRSRFERGQMMVEKLAAIGLPLDWARVQALAEGGTVGRPHVAQAMLEAGYVSAIPEAFDRYIGRGGPAYVERYKITPAEAVAVIARAGGVASLAHPGIMPDLETALDQLAAAGLTGVESYYYGYPPEQVERLVAAALARGLVPTGGSDYHGWPTMNDGPVGGVHVPLETVDRLRAARPSPSSP